MGAYRDDLEAAQQRSAALEAELLEKDERLRELEGDLKQAHQRVETAEIGLSRKRRSVVDALETSALAQVSTPSAVVESPEPRSVVDNSAGIEPKLFDSSAGCRAITLAIFCLGIFLLALIGLSLGSGSFRASCSVATPGWQSQPH